MDQLEIDKEEVEYCIDNTFEDEGDWQSYNHALREDREHANDLGIQLNPSVAINGHPYTGAMTGEEIFKAICLAYRHDRTPAVCAPDYPDL